MAAWAAWYHRNVRPINNEHTRDCWGWCATNGVPNSNHLSGTAVDLCGLQLPFNQHTIPADQVTRTEQGLALFEGTVFWGRWWKHPVDDRADLPAGPAAGTPGGR